ncbi:MAG: efflux RND transporter permease subunit [Marinilabiliales bacterium]|nr:efflux RND transporter permease subunit [Marinilabiliales bacterium]
MFINPAIDAASRSAKVVAEVAEPDGALKGGAVREGAHRGRPTATGVLAGAARGARSTGTSSGRRRDVFVVAGRPGRAARRRRRRRSDGDVVEVVSGARRPAIRWSTRGGFNAAGRATGWPSRRAKGREPCSSPNLSIKRPVVATVMMLALVTLGLFSYRRLADRHDAGRRDPGPVDHHASIPGASPETVEREVSQEASRRRSTRSRASSTSCSTSREGLSVGHRRVQPRGQDQRRRRRRRGPRSTRIRRDLPAGHRRSRSSRSSTSTAMPIVSLAVRSEHDAAARADRRSADRKVKRRLENIPGVGKAKLVGDVEARGRASTSTRRGSTPSAWASTRSSPGLRPRT